MARKLPYNTPSLKTLESAEAIAKLEEAANRGNEKAAQLLEKILILKAPLDKS